ncbi:TPA: hypothetical protein ACX6R6_002813 [Photobacterium damselae]
MKKYNREQVILKGDNSSLINADEYNLLVLSKQEHSPLIFINKPENTKKKSDTPHNDKSLRSNNNRKIKHKKGEGISNKKKKSVASKNNKSSFPKSISKKGFKKSKNQKNNQSNDLYSFKQRKTKSFSSGYSCTDYSKLYGSWGYSGGKCSPK